VTILRVAIAGLSVGLALVATILALMNRDTPTPQGMSMGSKAIEIVFPFAILTITAVGLLIAGRHPRHPVAWCFLGLGLGGEALFAIENYGLYGAITSPSGLPAAGTVLWIATWSWAVPTSGLVLALLLFPDGRAPSRRWWIVAWLALAGTIVQSAADALRSPLVSGLPLESPFTSSPPIDALDALAVAGQLLWTVAVLGAAASLVVRYRRARGEQRLQLKWVAYASSAAVVLLVAAGFFYAQPPLGTLASGVAALSVLFIPISAAIAILRYRLYDIDLLINRTLVYGATSAAIAATFFVGIVALQPLVRSLTSGSELAVAASTLVSFALFQPIRRRVQNAVDRRFDRSRYDAGRTLDDFADRLRDEVNLDALRSELLGAVSATIAPAHASLWLRERGR
jgi:hypothetical protein